MDREYVLGTHEPEIERLGLQHRVWRRYALDSWARAGLTLGSQVLDVGAGPGFATRDLAEVVGREGHVTALETSERFIAVGRSQLAEAGITQAEFVQFDLEVDQLTPERYDFAWCRWVLCFLKNPGHAIEQVFRALKPGGRFVIHEYLDYGTWSMLPDSPAITKFVEAVIQEWRDRGGEPNIARVLPRDLSACGFEVLRAEPIVFTTRPADYSWNWPKLFIENQADRLSANGYSQEDADAAREAIAASSGDAQALMISPTVMEIVAIKR